MSISRRVRFEILKRDGFTCQYCGRKPPAVVLHVDHIEPRSKGGADEEGNLITSCGWCNLGKGAEPLEPTHTCVVCGEHDGIITAEIPDVVLGRSQAVPSHGVVCDTCIASAVFSFVYALSPKTLQCAACGDWYTLDDPHTFTTDMIVEGRAAWVCPRCMATDVGGTTADGPFSPRLYVGPPVTLAAEWK